MSETADEIFAKYFDWNKFILKVCGLWMSEKHDLTRALQYIPNFVMVAYLCLYQPAETAVIIVAPNLDIFVRSLRDNLNHIVCLYKILRFFQYKKEILALIETLNGTDYDESNLIQTAEIVKKHKKEADQWMLLFLIFCNTICLNMLAAVCYSFIFHYEDLYEVNEDGVRIYAQKLPVTLLTPFAMTTRLSFILHFAFEIIFLDYCAWMIVGLDGLFTSLISCISAHFVILQQALCTIRVRCLRRMGLDNVEMLHDSPDLDKEMVKEMKKCIKHLQMLIKASDMVEKIYNIQTVGQVMVSLFEMCFCLYLLSTNLNENMGPELTYLVSTSFELLLYCWFGNSITESSIAIPDAIYKSDWLSSSRSFKSLMLITMTRMKKPICVTIGKFTPLTFTTFLSIGRAAYSFFTVLKSQQV